MKSSVLVVLFVLCSVITALSQTETATISGRVTDPSGAAISGADVQVQNVLTGQGVATKTNSSGLYVASGLQPGMYRVIVSNPGFKQIVKPDVVLNVQDNASINFGMTVGSVSETMTIDAGAPLVNTQDASVGTVIDRGLVENMPLNGRTFQSLIALAPGVTLTPGNEGQFSINGQRAGSNYVTVDGVSANTGSDPAQNSIGTQPGLTANGGTNSLASVEALQEFRVQTSNYAPEYGRAPGGQISIVTRSGTNQFHGTAFEYFRNDALDAPDWFVNHAGERKPAERQNDFGGVFGGPIVIPSLYDGRNHSFFFFSYEGLRLVQPQATTFDVPSMSTRQGASTLVQPYLAAMPVPNGPEFTDANGQPIGWAPYAAAFSSRFDFNSTSLRLDHQTGSVRLFARYNYAPSFGVNRTALVSSINRTTANNQTLTLGATAMLSSTTVSEFRLNYSTEAADVTATQDPLGGASKLASSMLCAPPLATSTGLCEVNFNFNGLFQSVGDGRLYGTKQKQFNVVGSLERVIGTHGVKIGADVRRLLPTANHSNWSQANFNSLSSTQSGILDDLQLFHYSPVGLGITQVSLYAQDSWQLPRLTITYGLRWDYNPSPTVTSAVNGLRFVVPVGNTPSGLAVGAPGTPLYAVGSGKFAPRVGVAYSLRQNTHSAMVLRGGLGLFIDTPGPSVGQVSTYQQYPFVALDDVPSVPLPLAANSNVQLPPLPVTNQPPYPPFQSFIAYESGFTMPYTVAWNVALEQALTENQSLTITYIGNQGRRLVSFNAYLSPSTSFQDQVVVLYGNRAASTYNGLQAQFQRRLKHGLQAQASYTWAHAIDDASDFLSLGLLHGNADVDIRHTLSGAVSYSTPHELTIPAGGIFRDWAIDSLVNFRSATPVTPTDGSLFLPNGSITVLYPNVVPGVAPLVYGSQYPGGKAINTAAFVAPAPGSQGDSPRNSLRGFGLSQIDMALRRDFPLHEHVHLQFRVEAFNVFNHPNFYLGGSVPVAQGVSTSTLATALGTGGIGGLNPLYSIGGPRSLQISLKLKF